MSCDTKNDMWFYFSKYFLLYMSFHRKYFLLSLHQTTSGQQKLTNSTDVSSFIYWPSSIQVRGDNQRGRLALVNLRVLRFYHVVDRGGVGEGTVRGGVRRGVRYCRVLVHCGGVYASKGGHSSCCCWIREWIASTVHSFWVTWEGVGRPNTSCSEIFFINTIA